MEKLKALAEKHPWATAGVIFVVGVIIIYWWSSGSSAPAASSDNSAAYNAAGVAAAGNDALQASQMQNQTALAIAQANDAVTTAHDAAALKLGLVQANAPVLEAQIAGNVQTQSLADSLAAHISDNATAAGISADTNKTALLTTRSNNKTALATTLSNNATTVAQGANALTALENTNAELVSVAGINASAGETINAQNAAVTQHAADLNAAVQEYTANAGMMTAENSSDNQLSAVLDTNHTNYLINGQNVQGAITMNDNTNSTAEYVSNNNLAGIYNTNAKDLQLSSDTLTGVLDTNRTNLQENVNSNAQSGFNNSVDNMTSYTNNLNDLLASLHEQPTATLPF